MATFHLRCSECDARYEEDPDLLVCPRCARSQERGGCTRGILRVVLDELPGSWPEAASDAPEFLAAFLPVQGPDSFFGYPVGNTPLLAPVRLREHLGMAQLWLKDETRNPSGSCKDRASALVVAKAREYGRGTIATASTGNAASALAACTAAAGLEAVVFVPADAPPAKLTQVLVHGARLVPIAGSYDDCLELCRTACERHGWYDRSTARNPFTIEGKKSAALEIARQLGGGPDAVLVPCGDGVVLAGLAKGFADLRRAGLIARLPRLIAVQPRGCAAIVRAWSAGAAVPQPVVPAVSIADSLRVEMPRGGLLCLREIEASRGAGVLINDGDIQAAILELGRDAGVFAEPAGAAALAGLHAVLAAGLVERRERIVLLVTGSGLKDPRAARALQTLPEPIAPTLAALAERLERSA